MTKGEKGKVLGFDESPLLISDKDKFVVMVPAVLLQVHARLELCRRTSGCPGATTSAQPEPLLLQHIERLLYEGVLQEEPRCVAVGSGMVGVSALVECLTEDVPTEGDTSADENPWQLPEFNVCQTVSSERETSPVSDCYEPGMTGFLAGWNFRVGKNSFRHLRKTKVGGLLNESTPLTEAFRQDQRLISQIVQHIPEEHTVPVQEVLSFDVFRRWVRPTGEHTREKGVGHLPQGRQRRGVKDTSDV